MTAPVASKILLPDDTGNTGKLVRTQTRVVGVDTVHEHFFVPNSEYTIVSSFKFSAAQQTILQTAHTPTATAFFYLQNPVASTVTAVIRRIFAQASVASALVGPTAPVVSFAKFTFTGTASGAVTAVLPWRTGGTTNQMIVRALITGMTVTLVAEAGSFVIPAAMTGVGQYGLNGEVIPFNPLAFQRGRALEIGPGEGLVVYQSVGGTASDTRKLGLLIDWDEVDLT